ncbi:MAG: hypothetical protein EPO35_12010 [Acidobacteria bacterium]|nr:MAG: hypothetical protein EPO35_12010 [Acidobacteriota bacterium]
MAVTAFISFSAVSVRAQAAGVAGVWKLNEAESNNPNGPAPAAAPQRGRSGARGGGDNFDATGGAARPGAGAQQMSQLSPEETSRIRMMMQLMNKAAQSLEIIVEGGDVTIKQDGSGFPKQNADGKKFSLRNPQIGEVDIKIKIDAKGMTREVTTQDDLKVVETYTLSADGKSMTVTVKPSQPVMKIEDAKIKRVYYRQ